MVAMKGLFGKRKQDPFGQMQAMPTPVAETSMSAQPMGAMPVNNPKAGLGTRLFGQGWEDKAFALGGIMQGDPSGVYMMRKQEQAEQQARAEAAAEERKRALDWADFRREHDYKVANPSQNPTSLQQNYEWLQQNHPDAADAYLERMTNNYEYRQGADGRFYRIDIGDAQPQVLGSELPQGWTVEGGSGGNAGGGF